MKEIRIQIPNAVHEVKSHLPSYRDGGPSYLQCMQLGLILFVMRYVSGDDSELWDLIDAHFNECECNK